MYVRINDSLFSQCFFPDLKSGIRINYLEVCVSGALSQLVVVPCLVAPVERIKVLLQVYPPEKFRGQLHCLTHLIR
jgi:hypothetical protein